MKTPADAADETTPLLNLSGATKGAGGTAAARKSEDDKKADGAVDEVDEDNPELWASCLTTNEPHTSRYKADNPTPAYLVASSVGAMVTQSMIIFAGYMFLTINAENIFPKCERLGSNGVMYWLCVTSGLGLWTFPLVCQAYIPLNIYLTFCDMRLYYECLREKVLLRFSSKGFFESHTFFFLISYLLMGFLFVILSAVMHGDPVRLNNTLRGLLPFLFPALNFLITLFNSWDLKFFLVTLSNFVVVDLEWSKAHIQGCLEMTPFSLAHLYEENEYIKGLEGKTSREVFGAVYQLCQKKEDGLFLESGTSSFNVHKLKPSEIAFKAKQDWIRLKALFFGQKGFWITDLLWLPHDNRGKQFRMAFRVMYCILPAVEIFVLCLIACTVGEYLTRQNIWQAPWWMRISFLMMEENEAKDEAAALYKWLHGEAHAKFHGH